MKPSEGSAGENSDDTPAIVHHVIDIQETEEANPNVLDESAVFINLDNSNGECNAHYL